MTVLRVNAVMLAGIALSLLMLAGCGLKGPLTMPAKSTNVVIRGPGGETVSSGSDASPVEGAANGSPPAPAAKPGTGKPGAATPAPAEDLDHPPPPPLPGGNPGARGG